MPPRKKTTEETVTSLDDLLDSTTQSPEVEEPSPESASEEVSEEEAPEARRIRELEEQLRAEEDRARTNPTTSTGRPLPEASLTSEQKRIRELEDRLAQKRADNFEKSGLEPEDSKDGILIHVLEDGLSAQGHVYYRGQEISFGPTAYEQSKDRYGNSWLDQDETDQMRRYGRIMFRKGPWPGEGYDDGRPNRPVNAPVIHI